jgi:ribose transport system substrate-binding protein
MEQVAKTYGIRWVEYTNQGQPSQWVQGIDTAIAEHASLVILGGAPSPYQLQPQLKELKAHNIPVEVTHVVDPSAPMPPYVTALVPAAFDTVSRLIADYTILQAKGHAQVLVITSNDILASPGQGQAFKQELAAHCGSGCKAYLVNVPTQDWATDIQTTVESFLRAHPEVNWVYPLYDSESEFAAPGIAADGDTGKVFIATYNGTPAILKLMETGSIVKFEIGEDLTWLGWAQMDQAMRILTGAPPVKNENTALRVFTDSTVSQTGVPPKYNEGYGNAFMSGYLKLWGAS